MPEYRITITEGDIVGSAVEYHETIDLACAAAMRTGLRIRADADLHPTSPGLHCCVKDLFAKKRRRFWLYIATIDADGQPARR